MRFLKITLLVGTMTGLGLGCGSGSDKATDAGAVEDETGVVLDVAPSQVVGTIMLSLGTLNSGAVAASGLWLRDPASDRDENCTESGAPAEDGEELYPADEGYVQKAAYCLASFNSVSPDTTLGAMYLSRGVSCMAGLEGLYDELEPGETATAEAVDLGAAIMDEDNDCWGTAEEREAFIAGMSEEGGGENEGDGPNFRLQDDDGGMVIKISVQRLEDSNFDYTALVYFGGDEDPFFQLDIKAGETMLAARGQELDRDVPIAWMVSMDSETGEIRYAGGGASRVIQIYLKGEVDEETGTVNLAELESMSALSLKINEDSGNWFEFYSIDGGPTQGFYTNLKYLLGEVEQEDLGTCLGTADECSSFEKLQFSVSAFNSLVTNAPDFATNVATRTDFFQFDRVSLSTTID